MAPVLADNGVMAKRKKPSTDRHKPGVMVRIPMVVIRQLDRLVQQNASSRAEEARIGLREYLKSRDLWPPKPD
jgi:hypothetical protein